MEKRMMVKIDGKLFFTVGDVAAIIFKESATIRGWDKYSNTLEQEAIVRGEDGEKARLIPKAQRVNGRRLYSWEQVQVISKFSDSIERGTLSKYSRTRTGKKGKEIEQRAKVKEEKNELRDISEILNKAKRGNKNIGLGSW
jgi:hypothetical protein